MSCINQKEKSDLDPQGQGFQASQLSGAFKDNIQEKIGRTVDIASSTAEAEELLLNRGQYRLRFKVPMQENEDYITVENQKWKVRYGGEFKRVFIHKLDMINTGETDENDHNIYQATAVITMIDNPVWLVPALWAVTAVGGTVGSWFVVDKVQEFSETGVGSILTLGLTALGIFVAWKSYSG